MQDQIELRLRHPPYMLRENGSIDGYDLRDIRDRILCKPCVAALQEHVARSGGPAEIARERDNHDRRQTTCVQSIPLDDHYRAREPGT